VSYSNFLLALIFASLTPSLTISETAKASGDWAFQKKDNACVAVVRSPNLQHSYILYRSIELDELVLNWIEGPGVNDTMKGLVVFEFDKVKKLNVAIADIDGFQFEPLHNNSNDPIVSQLKKGKTFSMYQNSKLVAGPFSLKGSGKVLKWLSDC
jgi:hypothetical protein